MSDTIDVDVERDRRLELARFLRARRERLSPTEIGLASQRRRRTPGLRREEVAYLADIGTKWYTRLELGDRVRPSEGTLLAIARALRMNDAEIRHAFRLAQLNIPELVADDMIPPALVQHVVSLSGCGATLYDAYITPLYWNAVNGALFDYPVDVIPFERNAIVRAFHDPNYMSILGPNPEGVMRRCIGMFRREYTARTPSAIAQQIMAAVKDEPLFQRYWADQVVAEEQTDAEPFERHHEQVGVLRVTGQNLYLNRRDDVFVRLLLPADAETTQKMALLAMLGTASPAE